MIPPVLLVVNITEVLAVLQTTRLAGSLTCAVGFTVIVNVFGGPLQVTPLFVYCGVTVIVATTGAVPLFTAVKAPILPEPMAARPMLVALLVQL